MLYWDTSALFAFLINEKHSAKLRSLVQHQGSSTAYTAIITPLEFESAIQRRLSERTLNLREVDRARLFGVDFRKQAFLVPLDQNALDTALHLQKIYGLRPGDAIQLASARLGTDNPSRVVFLCLDEKLTEAAKREGFQTHAE
jgi:predicted nucleic acid-binding protein